MNELPPQDTRSERAEQISRKVSADAEQPAIKMKAYSSEPLRKAGREFTILTNEAGMYLKTKDIIFPMAAKAGMLMKTKAVNHHKAGILLKLKQLTLTPRGCC